MWYCPECGSQNGKNAAFCDNCGAPRPAEAWTSAKSGNKKKWMWIGGGAALVLLAALLLILLPGGQQHYRLLRSSSTDSDGVETVTVYTYQSNGRDVTIESYRNGSLTGASEATADENGALLTVVRRDSTGRETSREERENDRYGNPVVIRLYRDGKLIRTTEREYNAYHAVEKQTIVEYDENGAVLIRQVFAFSDRSHGTLYREDASGQRELLSRYERVYEGNSLVRQTAFDLEGNPAIYWNYTRDEDYNVLTESIEYVNIPERNIYTSYQWEKID